MFLSFRYVAQEFLAPKALAFVKKSLGSTYNETLGAAGPWADTVRHTKGYTWSAPFHFVDANDSPLDGSCSVDETRDCGSGKRILSAIANYTTRVAKTSLSAKQRQEALKFLGTFTPRCSCSGIKLMISFCRPCKTDASCVRRPRCNLPVCIHSSSVTSVSLSMLRPTKLAVTTSTPSVPARALTCTP